MVNMKKIKSNYKIIPIHSKKKLMNVKIIRKKTIE